MLAIRSKVVLICGARVRLSLAPNGLQSLLLVSIYHSTKKSHKAQSRKCGGYILSRLQFQFCHQLLRAWASAAVMMIIDPKNGQVLPVGQAHSVHSWLGCLVFVPSSSIVRSYSWWEENYFSKFNLISIRLVQLQPWLVSFWPLSTSWLCFVACVNCAARPMVVAIACTVWFYLPLASLGSLLQMPLMSTYSIWRGPSVSTRVSMIQWTKSHKKLIIRHKQTHNFFLILSSLLFISPQMQTILY